MAAILAGNNVEEEYLWSCTLTGSNKEYTWEPSSLEPERKDEEQEGPKVKPGHRLLIKTAILMPNAKKDEVTVVQIDGEGYNKQRVKSFCSNVYPSNPFTCIIVLYCTSKLLFL